MLKARGGANTCQRSVRIAFPSWALNCSEATPEPTLHSNEAFAARVRIRNAGNMPESKSSVNRQ